MATKVRSSTQLIADSAAFTALSVSTAASSNNDVVNLATLNEKITQGRTWRESLLHADQLVDGMSGGFKSAIPIWGVGNLSNNQTIILKNATVEETYTAKDSPAGGNDFQIGGDFAATAAAFLAKVNANSDADDGWSAVAATDLSSFGSTAYQVIIIANNVADTTSRIYGSASNVRRAAYSATSYDYQLPAGPHNLTGTDPATRTFGVNREYTYLKAGETHKILDGVDVDYVWDADQNAWTVSGLSVTAGNGIEVTGTTVAAKRDVTGGANVATAISVGTDGIGVRIDGATIDYDAGTGRLQVKDGGIGTTQLGADCVDGTKIADNAIGSEHITAGAVEEGALAANAVTENKINDGAVTAGKIGADAVNGDKIADDAIGAEHIADGAVGTAALGADAVDGTKIADDSIGSEHIAAGAVDTTALGDDAVTAAKLSFFRDFATGDAIETAFTLSGTPSDGALLLVFNGGIIQRGGGVDYTLATNTVTFTAAPGDGDELQFFCVAI